MVPGTQLTKKAGCREKEKGNIWYYWVNYDHMGKGELKEHSRSLRLSAL